MTTLIAAKLTKIFEFSASHSKDGKHFGHNYVLQSTFFSTNAADDDGLSEKIHTALIQKIHSRDLGESDDLSLLKSFWPSVEKAALPAALHSLCLIRDRRTQWTITASD